MAGSPIKIIEAGDSDLIDVDVYMCVCVVLIYRWVYCLQTVLTVLGSGASDKASIVVRSSVGEYCGM